jgi:hypothetical protein
MSGSYGTANRKRGQQRCQTYRHRATSRLYRLPMTSRAFEVAEKRALETVNSARHWSEPRSYRRRHCDTNEGKGIVRYWTIVNAGRIRLLR